MIIVKKKKKVDILIKEKQINMNSTMKNETESLQRDFDNHACTKKNIFSNDGSNEMVQTEHWEKEI
jgi:hypothetical protein